MPIVDESKQNKGVNNNTRNKQMAIDMEYYNRLNHLRFKSPYLGAKYQQRVIPVRTLNGVQDVFVDNRGTIKQGGHTHSKLYNYSNRNRTHPIKGAYAREVDSWNNNTSPIKALVNSGIGYALAPAAQAVYDYTKGALDISKNPTKASNYLVMLPAIGYAVKAPLKRGVEVAMRTSNNANPIEDIVYNMHKASPKKHAGVLSYISTGVGYNTYAPEAYTGFQKAAKGNDMIDAYLYNKTINPSYGVKKINVDYGPHENYIRKIYPYKDIPVYENTETLDFFTKKPMQKASNITNKKLLGKVLIIIQTLEIMELMLLDIQFRKEHLMVRKYIEHKIFGSFNPDEYKQKWSSYDLDSKAVLGLKILDKLGTPVIIRTIWLYR